MSRSNFLLKYSEKFSHEGNVYNSISDKDHFTFDVCKIAPIGMIILGLLSLLYLIHSPAKVSYLHNIWPVLFNNLKAQFQVITNKSSFKYSGNRRSTNFVFPLEDHFSVSVCNPCDIHDNDNVW